MTSENAPCDDLFWLAMRYVEGDLSAAERRRFEHRLSRDEAACEAVALAARLSAGLRAAAAAPSVSVGRSVLPARSRQAPRPWRPLAVCAALLLGMAGIAALWRWSSPASADLASAELASRWTIDSGFSTIDDLDVDDDWESETEIVDEGLSVPGWLVAAVQLTSPHEPEEPQP